MCIAGPDRPGLERLLRYCARPPFALERIEQVDEDRIVYRLREPQRDGRTALSRLSSPSRREQNHARRPLLAAKRPSTPTSAAAWDRGTVSDPERTLAP
ncbi:MAG: hypothetical protein EHM71_18775 [Zetaproteobacteria bacterium]|nr:MAG: hypothetical protein EHM71_18775 [Zetaproteobacteria bacterium]